MKKTLITLMALASCAMGAVNLESSDFTYTLGNSATTTDDGTFSYVLTIDAEALRKVLEKGQSPTWGTEIITYNCNGTITGIVTNGGSNNNKINTSSLFAKWGANNAWGNFMHYEDQKTVTDPETGQTTTVPAKTYNLSDLNGDIEGTGWDDVAGAGIVYTFDKDRGSKAALTLCNENGETIFSYVHTMSGLRSSHADAAAVEFGDMVTSYYYNNATVLSEADAKEASRLAAVLSMSVVPEPATATLSLLALAGLAARRRRK